MSLASIVSKETDDIPFTSRALRQATKYQKQAVRSRKRLNRVTQKFETRVYRLAYEYAQESEDIISDLEEDSELDVLYSLTESLKEATRNGSLEDIESLSEIGILCAAAQFCLELADVTSSQASLLQKLVDRQTASTVNVINKILETQLASDDGKMSSFGEDVSHLVEEHFRAPNRFRHAVPEVFGYAEVLLESPESVKLDVTNAEDSGEDEDNISSSQAGMIAEDTAIAEVDTDLPDYEAAIQYIAVQSQKLSKTPGQQNKKAGEMWEKLVVEFLRTDPVYRKMFAKVYLWSEWTTDPDIGIDIVCETYDGKLVAIQCKFSGDPERSLQKGAIDSFISTSDTKKWAGRYVFWSGFKVSPHIDSQICEEREVPLNLITGSVLRTTNTSWAELATTGKGHSKPLKKVREYQTEAVDKIEAKLAAADKSKLIMACGSGKTYTSQLIAEQTAGIGKTVLYVVPSIALMGQTMREWAQEEDTDRLGVQHSFMGVCSDSGVGKDVKSDSMGGMHKTDIAQLEMDVGTDAKDIAKMLNSPIKNGHMRTVFSTYQSLPKIKEAQKKYGAPDFDLMFCDEAHRTTGLGTSAEKEDSHFQMPHNDGNIAAKKRVYMTATPKVFSERSKSKAKQSGKAIYAMDDSSVYGDTAFQLSFSKAIDLGVLADYKVHIIQVAEHASAAVLNKFTQMGEEAGIKKGEATAMLKTDVCARLVGLWQALVGGEGVKTGGTLWKSIVYMNTIRDSKAFKAVFPLIAEYLNSLTGNKYPTVKVEHVDGAMSATTRQQHLSWLDGAKLNSEIRVLSNAKCLSEGVDVPSLDGVAFLVPKGSIVEIVQSVGRVIRAAPLKQYGHVILPAVIPSAKTTSREYDSFLKNDGHWKTTWQVLRALRAHDDKFAQELALMELEVGNWPERIGLYFTADPAGGSFCFAGGGDEEDRGGGSGTPYTTSETDKKGKGEGGGGWDGTEEEAGSGSSASISSSAEVIGVPQQQAQNPAEYEQEAIAGLEGFPEDILKMLQENIAVKMVENVGDRQYWDHWGKDAAKGYNHVLARLRSHYESDENFKGEVNRTADGLIATLGSLGSADEVLNVLSQFFVVRPVFASLFGTGEQFEDSPLSEAMLRLAEVVEVLELDNEMGDLEEFYAHIAEKAAMVKTPQEQQKLIKALYEDFIHTVFPEEAKKYGVVYTPNEVVDFTLRSVDWALKEYLGIDDGVASEDVEVLDPFAGTGTFLSQLISNPELIPEDKLEHKFKNNLHTTEVMALPYWATELNMEQAYKARMGEYVPYDKGVLADTFSMSQERMQQLRDSQRQLDLTESNPLGSNISLATAQDESKITCIVGNPPWAVGKTGEWEELQNRIKETYAHQTSTASKNSLYDSYVLAIRWASDRIGDRGVIGFVTNNSFLHSNTGSGIRRVMEEEFDHVLVVDMLGKGGAAVSNEQRILEGENVFKVTVGNSITLLIKTGEGGSGKAQVQYATTTGLSAAEKLSRLSATSRMGDTAGGLEWEAVEADYRGDWIAQGHEDWKGLKEMGNKLTKQGKEETAGMGMYSNGILTGLKHYLQGSAPQDVLVRGEKLAVEFNRVVEEDGGLADLNLELGTKATWLADNIEKHKRMEQSPKVSVGEHNLLKVMGAPWLPQYVLAHKTFNQSQSRLPDIYDISQTGLTELPTEAGSTVSEMSPGEREREVISPLAQQVNREQEVQQDISRQDLSQNQLSSAEHLARYSQDIGSNSLIISVASKGTATGFRSVAHRIPASMELTEKSMSFPRYSLTHREQIQGGTFDNANGSLHGTSASDGRVYVDNINDSLLVEYREHYSDDSIVKDQIFYYFYAILNHPEYQQKYKNDLFKDLPRIPMAPDFHSFAEAGEKLALLHADYDSIDPWEGDMTVEFADGFDSNDRSHWYVTKAKFDKDKKNLKFNDYITIRNVPAGAFSYKIAGKSPIEQFVSDTCKTVDKKTGIENDVNDLYNSDPSEVLLRACQLIRVGVETSELIAGLPEEFE